MFIFTAAGCASFEGVGYFHRNRELFSAKIEYNLYTTMAAIEVSGKEGLFCSGAARTKFTTKTYWSCMGAQGNFFMSCNDGRHLVAKWSADSCSSGQAIGSDQFGNTFVAAFGERRAEMLRRVGVEAEAAVQDYSDYSPNPAYARLLGYDSDEEALFYSAPQELREQPPASAQKKTSVEVYGFLINQEGYLLACAESLPAAAKFMVSLPERPALPASLISYDHKSGVAFFKTDLDAQGIPLAESAASSPDEALVFGQPRDGAPILNSSGEAVGLICQGKYKKLAKVRQVMGEDLSLSSSNHLPDLSLPELLKRYSGAVARVKILERKAR